MAAIEEGCNSMASRPSDREPTAATAHAHEYIYIYILDCGPMRCHTVNTLGPHGAQVPAEILEKSWRNPRDKTSHGLIYRRVSPILLPPVNDRYSRPKFLRFSVTLFLGEFPLLRARVEWARMMERVAVSVLRNENLTKV